MYITIYIYITFYHFTLHLLDKLFFVKFSLEPSEIKIECDRKALILLKYETDISDKITEVHK